MLLQVEVERALSAPYAAHPAQTHLRQCMPRPQSLQSPRATDAQHPEHGRLHTIRTGRSAMRCADSPIFVDPHVGSLPPAFLVQALEGTVQVGVELPAHEQPAEPPSELCAEAATAALRKPADERGRDGCEFVIGQTPVSAMNRSVRAVPEKRLTGAQERRSTALTPRGSSRHDCATPGRRS